MTTHLHNINSTDLRQIISPNMRHKPHQRVYHPVGQVCRNVRSACFVFLRFSAARSRAPTAAQCPVCWWVVAARCELCPGPCWRWWRRTGGRSSAPSPGPSRWCHVAPRAAADKTRQKHGTQHVCVWKQTDGNLRVLVVFRQQSSKSFLGGRRDEDDVRLKVGAPQHLQSLNEGNDSFETAQVTSKAGCERPLPACADRARRFSQCWWSAWRSLYWFRKGSSQTLRTRSASLRGRQHRGCC